MKTGFKGVHSLYYMKHPTPKFFKSESCLLINNLFFCCCAVLCAVVSDSLRHWTVDHQASLPIGFFRQEYWNGLPFPPPRNLPDPGMEPMSPVSPALQVDSLLLSHLGSSFFH